jgi:hypothetical protein
MAEHANTLPNLQLLEGAINNEKRATLPASWLATHLTDPTSHLHYREKHELGDLPEDLVGFENFFAARRDRLRAKLISLLGNSGTASMSAAGAE